MSQNDSQLRPELFTVLRNLRSRIRRYVLFEGTASIVAVLGIAFWISLAIDYNFELPQVVRGLILFGTGCLFLCTLVVWILLRLFREIKLRALALVLERRFPNLNDRLVTVVELAESPPENASLTASMLRRVADEVSQLTSSLRLREVFNIRPLLRATLAAVCLIVSIAAFGLLCDDVLQQWYRRNVLLANEYWPRKTDLNVVVLADPGERIREFKDGIYKHPRGSDLTLLASVPEGKLIPQQVQFSFDLVSKSGGRRDFMTKVGQAQFKHTIAGLHDSLELWFRGGDFASRLPYHVEVVDPPRVDHILLDCLYPAYTDKNTRDEAGHPVRDPVQVQGTQVSLPAGTEFLLQGRVNKPLTDVLIQSDGFELAISHTAATLKVLNNGAAGASTSLPFKQPLLSDDGLTFRVPCLLSTRPVAETASRFPLQLPADSVFRITLHDTDDITSAEPTRLTLNSIPDESPRIELQLKGIGTSVTRQAVIPLAGAISDDYGVAEAHFDFKVNPAEAKFETRAFAANPQRQKKFDVSERFEVLPLEMKVGGKLTVAVATSDTDDLTGPHRVQGEKYVFQIVSNDELVSLIAARELNLRRRFEQILEELKDVRKDLQAQRKRLEEALRLKGAKADPAKETEVREQLAGIEIAAITSAERAINGTRKNANETVSVEESFRDIREELINNALPDIKPMLERIDDGIITPLHSITTIDYNQVDESLGVLKRELDRKGDPFRALDGAVDQIDATIKHMEAVLTQMLKLETFNEALQLLRDIIQNQEEIQQKTKTERKKKLIEGLQ